MDIKRQLETILKEGFLDKESRFLKSWRKRWFVLTQQTLMTFKQRKQYNSPTEVIQLKDIVSIKSCDDETHKEFSFKIDTKDETFFVGASSNTEKQQWIGQIGTCFVILGKAMVKVNTFK